MKVALFFALAVLFTGVFSSCTTNGGGSADSGDGYYGPAPVSPVERTTNFSTGLGEATRSTIR